MDLVSRVMICVVALGLIPVVYSVYGRITMLERRLRELEALARRRQPEKVR